MLALGKIVKLIDVKSRITLTDAGVAYGAVEFLHRPLIGYGGWY
jgi:hypothetical protein